MSGHLSALAEWGTFYVIVGPGESTRGARAPQNPRTQPTRALGALHRSDFSEEPPDDIDSCT